MLYEVITRDAGIAEIAPLLLYANQDAKNTAGSSVEELRHQGLELQSLHRYRQYRLNVKRPALLIRDR